MAVVVVQTSNMRPSRKAFRAVVQVLLWTLALCNGRLVHASCSATKVASCTRRLQEDSRSREARIVGGTAVCPSFAYGHVVPLVKGPYMLTSSSFQHWFCGGTLYGRQHVVTAAHCVHTHDGVLDVDALRGLAVEVHRSDLSTPLCTECSIRIAVASFASHPDFDSLSLNNDIAVLRLAEPVPDSIDISNVTLDTSGDFLTDGQVLIAAGWGAVNTNSDNPIYSEILNAVELDFIPKSTCTSSAWTYRSSDLTSSSTSAHRSGNISPITQKMLFDGSLYCPCVFSGHSFHPLCCWNYRAF